MSKYSTEELVKTLYDLSLVAERTSVSAKIDAIIARLRAEDELCEAVKEMLGDGFNVAPTKILRTIRVRKAIANYEGKGKI